MTYYFLDFSKICKLNTFIMSKMTYIYIHTCCLYALLECYMGNKRGEIQCTWGRELSNVCGAVSICLLC